MKVVRRPSVPILLVVLGVFVAGCGEWAGGVTDEPQVASSGEATSKTDSRTEPRTDARTPAETYGEYSEDAVVLAIRLSKEPSVSTARVAAVDGELRRIREKYPRLRDVHARQTFALDEVLVSLAADTPGRTRWADGKLETGDSALDSLLEEYGASGVEAISKGGATGPDTFIVSFDGPLDIQPLARKIQAASPDVRYAEPNAISGDGDDITLKTLEGGAKRYSFSEGSGDCAAGCIDRNVWAVVLDADGGLSMEKTLGDGRDTREAPEGSRTTF